MRWLLLACAIAIAAPGAAGAAGAGVIAANGPDRAAVAEAMARALAGRAPGRARVVADAVAEARAALAAGAAPAEELARFRSVRAQIDEGWRAYLRVAVENAGLRLAGARTEAEGLLALPGGAEVYADAALRLGAVLGHLGRKAEAQAVLALALALDPDRPITLAEFSPDVIDAVEAARRAPAPIRRLRIATSPPGALIRVDGADVGRSPVDVEVVRGQHVIVARAPLHRPAVRGVAIGEGAAAVTLEL
ncbi:MAG TPA: PEGA domain-containing protein, partial [Kofleriaceae bacterium]|nr:PEGA domain-containing protein [Kofleriaceae bacterium]